MSIRDFLPLFVFFFFNDPATTEIYTLSLHDALPVWHLGALAGETESRARGIELLGQAARSEEHTSELQPLTNLVCRLLLEKKKKNKSRIYNKKKINNKTKTKSTNTQR